MPNKSDSTWRSLFGCCDEKAEGQVEGVSPESMPRASSAHREETRTASLPPDQVSLRSLPARNAGDTSLSPLHESATGITPVARNEPDTSNPRLNPNVPSEHETALQKLWTEAIAQVKASKDGNKLAEVMDAQENTQPANGLITSEELIRRLEQEMKRAGLKGKMADTMDKVVPHLNRFAIVGDVAVSANPNPAALPWAAVRFILLNLTAGSDIRAKIVEGTAKVTILVFECSVYQELYLDSLSSESPEIFGRLRETIVNSFFHSLRFLSFALTRQRSRAKVATDAFKLQDFVGYMEELTEAEKQLHEAGGMCEKFHHSQSREQLGDLHKLMVQIQNERADEKLQSQLKDLLLLDPLAASDHIHHPLGSFCLDGTREAVLGEIHDWVNDSKGPSVCWLPGLAGTGKSTIARTLSRDLKGIALAGSFFFKRGVASRGDAKRMVPLIAYQLARNLPSVAEHVADALRDDPSLVTAPLTFQWSKLIVQPLSKLTAHELPTTLVLVIDALDECDSEGDRKGILRLITMSCPTTLKVFLTSRPEMDIEGYFANEGPSRHEIVLHRVKIEDIQQDIEMFLKHSINDFVSEYNRVHPAQRSQLADGWPGNERRQLLITRSVPLFIAAATFMRMIRDHKWPLSPDRKVDFIIEKSSNVASKYGVLYEPVLSLVLSGAPDEARHEAKEGFLKIVGSIILLADPLSITSLASLLGVEVPDIDIQIDSLRSVTDIPADDRPITLFHLSFRDYLLSKMAGDLRVNESKVHALLVDQCMQVMKTRLRTDICGMGSPGRSRADFDREVINKNIPPELRYACTYWVHHLKGSGQRVRDDDHEGGVLSFLQNSFLNWLEVLCLCGEIVDPRLILEELQSIVDETAGIEVLQFLHDAKRFWSYFGEGMIASPLQLYHSGIVFCPRASTAPQPAKDRRCSALLVRPPDVDPSWMPYVQTLERYGDGVGHIAFLANGRFASSDDYGKIQVWNPDSGSYLQMLEEHEGSVEAFASWKNIKLASASERGDIKIWNLDDGACLQSLQIRLLRCENLAFSDDGEFLCSTSTAPWKLESWSEEEQQREGEETVEGEEPVGCVINLTSGKIAHKFRIEGYFPKSALSERGQWIARAERGSINLSRWDTYSDPTWIELGPHDGYVYMVVFSTDGKLLASASTSFQDVTTTIRVWRTKTCECLHAIQILKFDECGLMALTHDRLAVTLKNHQVIITDLRTGSMSKRLEIRDIRDLTFSPNGKLLATTTDFGDSLIRIWDPTTAQSSEIMDIHRNPVKFIAFTDGGTVLLSASRLEVKIWDIPSGVCRETHEMGEEPGAIGRLVTARCKSLFAVRRSKKFEVWHFSPLESIQTLDRGDAQLKDYCYNLVMSATGERLAIVSVPLPHNKLALTSLEVWDVKTGKLVQRLRDGLHRGSAYALSPDDARIAYTTEDTIEIFDKSGTHLLSVAIDLRYLKFPSPSFSFDGQRIVLIWENRAGRIWDSKTGRLLCEWSGELLDPPPAFDSWFLDVDTIARTDLPENPQVKDFFKPYHIDEGGTWLMKHDEKLLWLPPDYRPSSKCMLGSIMAVGAESGRVLILHLKD